MSKKQKRNVSKGTGTTYQPAARATSSSTSIPAPIVSTKSAPLSRTAPAAAEFNPDYGYVITDLKRIGLMAISALVILVTLSFFLR
jgi:hypothetical protein